jgi:tetratricopeptide (TPR) repeat protein
MLFYVVSEAMQRILSLWTIVFSGGRKMDVSVKNPPPKKEAITVDDLEPIVAVNQEVEKAVWEAYEDENISLKTSDQNEQEKKGCEKWKTVKNSDKIDSESASSTNQTPIEAQKTSEEKQSTEETQNSDEITPAVRAEIGEIAKLVRTKIARWEISDARSKIIEGLAMDKWNKELNCLLASLYERDNDYRKAEFIYKDLILVHETDAEIFMKLGFSLSIQGKFEIAYEIYKKLLDISESHIEAAEMLANIAHELGKHDSAVEHAKMFLRKHPRNADMLTVLSVSLIHLERKVEALEALEKLKLLDPYNPRIREMKEKLELELELSEKFVPPTQNF